MMEILKQYFKDNEINKVNQMIDQDQDFKEKIEKIKKGQIDLQLDQLQARVDKIKDSFEKRFEAFKKAVEEAEKQNPIEKAKDKVTKKVENKVEEVKNKATKSFLAKTGIGAIITKFNNIFEKVGSIFDNIWKKFLAASGLGGLLAYFGLSDDKDKKDEKTVENEEDMSTKKIQRQLVKDGKVEVKPKLKEDKENLDKTIGGYYKSGKFLIQNLLDEQFTSKDDFGHYITEIQDKKYSELMDLEYEEKIGGDEEGFDKVKRNLIGEDIKVLFNNILTKENFNKLIQNDKLKKIILKLGIDIENFDYKNLTIYQLFSLFSIVVSSSIVVGLKAIPGIGQSVLEKIFSLKDNIPGLSEIETSLKNNIQDFENNVIDKQTSKEILSLDNIRGKSSFNWNIDDFKSIKNQEKIKELLTFRDYIKNDIINNKKYNLGFSKLIMENITFLNVMELFISFKGEKINTDLKSSLIYVYIIKILDQGNDSGGYINNLGDQIKKNNSDILNENEQKLLKVITKKIIDKTWLDSLQNKIKMAKDATEEHIKNNPEIIAWVAGIALVLKFTPAGRVVSILYSLIGRKGMALLAGSGIFLYFYKQLDLNTQKAIQTYKEQLKEYGIDIDKYL